ncbi:MAG TPA: lysophospholipid acyltransferase family protein [Geothrix sp.]|nr:lysophospholipid acyltransferase family protein [Geothrix sp.]
MAEQNPMSLAVEEGEALASLPGTTPQGPFPGATFLRMARIFGSILRYHRLGARCEPQHGGRIPREALQALLSAWAQEVLPLLNLEVRRVGPLEPLRTPALFVGNHLSYLDIPVLLSQVPVVFLGKAEIARWPILGAAGRRAGMVFVQRESDGSRRQAVRAMSECLESRGMSLGLFPAGTTSLDEGRPWRPGAFKIAKEGGFLVQPFRLDYEPRLRAAFVGRDALLPHLHRLLKAGPIRATLEFGEPRRVEDPLATADACWRWSRLDVGTRI